MMGLAYLLAFIVYLLIFIAVVSLAVRHARKHGKSAKLWGGMAAFIMYNLVFWDFLPTLVVHQFYCAKDAGFWVYKTAEQWRNENPNVVVGPVKPPEGMVLDSEGNGKMYLPDGTRLEFHTYRDGDQSLEFYSKDGRSGYWLNDRLIHVYKSNLTKIVRVSISKESIVDSKNNESLSDRVLVGTGHSDYVRIWTNFGSCGPANRNIGKVWQTYENIGEK